MMFRGSGIKGMPIGLGNPHQSSLPFLPTNPTALLLPMSSLTFFNNASNEENTQQFWEGVSSGLATWSPRRECHPSTRPVFSRLDTPTPTGPACKCVPQTCHPQHHAPIHNNSTHKDITIWNHQKHTHRRNSEDIMFGLLLTQTDILLQMPSNHTLVVMPSTPRPRASTPIKNASQCHDFLQFSAFFLLSPKHPLI